MREKVYCGSLKGSGLSFGFDCRQAQTCQPQSGALA